jgi:hypothetical protein
MPRFERALDGYFIEPTDVETQLASAGFTLIAKVERQPAPDVEYPSRRCYLLAQRPQGTEPRSVRAHGFNHRARMPIW